MIGEDFPAVLAAAQDGNEDAFAVLWRDGNPAVLRYLRVAAPHAAEDVAAEIWVQVVRGLAGFRGGEQDWRAWLFTTARRRALDERRRRSRHPVVPLEDLPADASPAADAAGLALENMATAAAIAAVVALPPVQAEVIMLRVLAGLDTELVAKITGRNPNAVRVAAHRGLRRLAQLIAPEGVMR